MKDHKIIKDVVKYWVICNNKVIQAGTTEFYSDVIPNGYEYLWAYRSPGGIFVNVVPKEMVEVMVTEEETNGPVDLKAYGKEKYELYRMEM